MYETDHLRRLWPGSDCADELFAHARKQKKAASKEGFRDEDVDTDEE